jgi:hypothetical protein
MTFEHIILSGSIQYPSYRYQCQTTNLALSRLNSLGEKNTLLDSYITDSL